MSLREVHDLRLFDDATTDEWRARVYVRSGELGIEPRADLALMEALLAEAGPRRVQIVGPSGAGKTSLILRVIADLTRRALDLPREVLILRIGDRPESLTSPDEVMKLVLDTIAAHGHRFANVDPEILLRASADERVHNPRQIVDRLGANAQIVSYSVDIRQAYETLGFGRNPARLRQDLEDVLAQVCAASYRPVLVLDDTEKFVSPGANGTIETASVANLYHHGVRVLGELDLDLVIATHPRFEEVDHVREVCDRLAIPRVAVPELPADSETPGLTRILKRRLERGNVVVELDTVISPAAVEELQVLYHERDCDLRSVLKTAHDAAGAAINRQAEAIEARDVRHAVAA